MKYFILIVSVLVFVAFGVTAIIEIINYNVNCEDYLKLAGDAPNLVTAEGYLARAVDYIESHNLTNGEYVNGL